MKSTEAGDSKAAVVLYKPNADSEKELNITFEKKEDIWYLSGMDLELARD